MFGSTVPQNLMTNAITMKENKLYNHARNEFESDILCEQRINKHA